MRAAYRTPLSGLCSELSVPWSSRGAAAAASPATSLGLVAIATSGRELVGSSSLAHFKSSSAVSCIMSEVRLVVALRYAPSAVMRLAFLPRKPALRAPLLPRERFR